MRINNNHSKLKGNYLFARIGEKVSEFTKNNPTKPIINMGIGDVTKPLCEAVIKNLNIAVDEMSKEETFKGYGPYRGYSFLINPIIELYKKRDIILDESEIFISDGAKSDCANILNIFATNQKVLIPDPVYPAYMDTNIMYGNNIIFADATMENEFLPAPKKDVDADLIYICSPNNPTGATYNKSQLEQWVSYAIEKDAIILFDAAYKDFIEDENLPKSIFEIKDAKKCAIEICSFSKSAAFTGTRCGYTIIPSELVKEKNKIKDLWLRHQTSAFNGVSYIVQKGAQAVFTQEGQTQIKKTLNYYKENAKLMCEALDSMNAFYTGGKNSPYIWFKCFNSLGSWEFFDVLLNDLQIVGTPGEGFGKNGENFFRLTAFGTRENTKKAMDLLKSNF